jgi:hypothetical protein
MYGTREVTLKFQENAVYYIGAIQPDNRICLLSPGCRACRRLRIARGHYASMFSLMDARLRGPLHKLDHVDLGEIANAIQLARRSARRGSPIARRRSTSMSGGPSPRRKGDGIERELVELHRALGIHAERYPPRCQLVPRSATL